MALMNDMAPLNRGLKHRLVVPDKSGHGGLDERYGPAE